MDPVCIDTDITLRDGRAVPLRMVRPSDEAEMLQAFDRLSADARYMRFMRTVREPNLEYLRKVLAPFPEAGVGSREACRGPASWSSCRRDVRLPAPARRVAGRRPERQNPGTMGEQT